MFKDVIIVTNKSVKENWSMAITKRKRLSTSLSYQHFDFLSHVCTENKQTQSVIIEIALDLLQRELKDKNLYEVLHLLESDKQ